MTAKRRPLLDSSRDDRDVITLRKMADMMRDFRRAQAEEARLLAERELATLH
jgi:hypothetical protein